MFERIDYRVIRIDGEYAYLQKLEDENAEEKCVAMAPVSYTHLIG